MSIAEQLKSIMESTQASNLQEEVPSEEPVTDVTEAKKDKEEDKDEEEKDEADEKEAKSEKPAKKKKAPISFDVKEELNQFRKLAEEAELPEDTVEQLATVFEAAVSKNVKANMAQLEEDFDARVSQLSEEYEQYASEYFDGLVENMDGYLGYIAEEWMNNNEIALEKGVKAEVSESLLGGLKSLLAEHNIDVPEDKVDVVEKLQADNEKLIQMNEQLMEKGKKLSESVADIRKEKLIEEATDGLTKSQAEKFRDLVESFEYQDEETYSAKLHQIKESFFGKKADNSLDESVVTDNPVELTEETDTASIHPEVNELLEFFKTQK